MQTTSIPIHYDVRSTSDAQPYSVVFYKNFEIWSNTVNHPTLPMSQQLLHIIYQPRHKGTAWTWKADKKHSSSVSFLVSFCYSLDALTLHNAISFCWPPASVC